MAPQPKTAARVAMLNLAPETAGVIGDSFKTFHIQTVPLEQDWATRLQREKFDGCVLRLDDDCEAVLKTARSSASNKHMLLYCVTPDTRTASQFSRYGINALFYEPLDRSSALRVVRATNLLVLHEFRRYVRLPVAVEVEMESEGAKYTLMTVEVSSGGMSLHSDRLLPNHKNAKVTFTLPDQPRVSLNGVLCWRRDDEKSVGVRFNLDDPGRATVRAWIDKFLEFE